MLYDGKTGADSAPSHDMLHVFGFSLEDGLHAPIREISHPAGHVIPDGFTAGLCTECNALDPAGDGYVDSFLSTPWVQVFSA